MTEPLKAQDMERLRDAVLNAPVVPVDRVAVYPWTRYCDRCGVQLWLNDECGACARGDNA